jgi:nucleoside-diphosphate-sugar epimerase
MKKYNFLVTGGAGFIGSNMVDYLINQGHEVFVIDNLSTGKIQNLNEKINFIELDLSDIRNINVLKSVVKKVDYVIHMAAVPNVQQSIDDPLLTNKHNFQSTINLIESCRNTNVKKIIFSSTSAIYGNSDIIPNNETVKPNPLSPYALQKLIGEQYLKLYSDLYGLKSVCLRYFNVFGERMTNEGAYKSVISIFSEQKENNLPLTITNDGNQKRDFIYVGDVVVANYLSCIKDTNNFNIYNVGYGDNISVNEIANYFNQPKTYIGNRVEPFETLCDNTKIKNNLTWEPTISVKEWLKKSK